MWAALGHGCLLALGGGLHAGWPTGVRPAVSWVWNQAYCVQIAARMEREGRPWQEKGGRARPE